MLAVICLKQPQWFFVYVNVIGTCKGRMW